MMLTVMLRRLDPFLIALVLAVVLAAVLPVRGAWADAFEWLAFALIALLFFLQGAKLARTAIVGAFASWRFQFALLGFTFVFYPLLGLAAHALFAPLLPREIALGLIFLALAPSTVQSSVAFTSAARGDVAAAVAGAALSNIVGTMATPLLAAALMGASASGALGFGAIGKVAALLLLPFALGHFARPLIGGWVDAHRGLVSLADRTSIVLIVYGAASAAVVAGVWSRLGAGELALLLAACTAMLAISTLAAFAASRLLKLAPDRRATFVMCGTQKSLAAGVPMAKLLFAAPVVGALILPLMIFHQLQLMLAAVLAARFAAAQPGSDALEKSAQHES